MNGLICIIILMVNNIKMTLDNQINTDTYKVKIFILRIFRNKTEILTSYYIGVIKLLK